MPWTKTKYPNSMKKLPVAVRNKAIEIANAIIKENKKMEEGKLIATAIRHAIDMAANGKKKKKSTAKKKTKSLAVKKVKRPAKSKSKSAVSKKTKKSPVAKTRSLAVKKVKRPAISKTKSAVSRKAKKIPEAKTVNPVIETPVTEKITHGDDLHLIPVEGEINPISTEKVHQIENEFHHREEVAFHQGNLKVKDAMSTRKNTNRIFRNRGRR